MREVMLKFEPKNVDLDPAPINPDWIVRGAPAARNKKLLNTRDWMGAVLVWDCTVGDFHWHYDKDEIIYLLAGEAFVSTGTGPEHRLTAGDLVFFPAGFVCNWRVTQPLRKFAVLKEPIWAPVAMCIKVGKRLLRLIGLARRPHWPPIVDELPNPVHQTGELEPREPAAGAPGTGFSRP